LKNLKDIYMRAQDKKRQKRFLKILHRLDNKDKTDRNLRQIWKQYIELIAGGNDTATSLALPILNTVISYIPDKQQAWEDLLRVVAKANKFPLELSAPIFYYNFEFLPDKQIAWEDLYKLTSNKKSI
jgi:hypothetical protein